MILVNVAELKGHIGSYIDRVAKGEEVGVCRRNKLVAKLEPISPPKRNRTKLGRGKGTATIHGDLTDSLISEDWEMLEDTP